MLTQRSSALCWFNQNHHCLHLHPHTVPDIRPLTANIMASTGKLFFVSHRIPGSLVKEWALICVDMLNSLKEHPYAPQDGKFLVEFPTCHYNNKYFNAINQSYWLEHHPLQ